MLSGATTPTLRAIVSACSMRSHYLCPSSVCANVATVPFFRLLKSCEWKEMQENGYFPGTIREREVGFIHLSPINEIGATANKHFANEHLFWILKVDSDALLQTNALRWKLVPGRGSSPFGHLYAPLPLYAIASVYEITHDTSFWQNHK